MLQPRRAGFVLMLSSLAILSGAQSQQCAQGWYRYQDKCYFFSQATTDWGTAQSSCVNKAGVLATVNSKAEVLFLSQQAQALTARRAYYLGASDTATEGRWRNVDASPFPSDHSIWAKGQPDNLMEVEDCTTLMQSNGYLLSDSPCNAAYNFICERSIDYQAPCDSENGWQLVGSKCYKYFKETANWLEARQSCQDNDADMLVVNTNDELSLVTRSAASDSHASVWLGYSDANDGKRFQWVDGRTSPASVMRWDIKNGEPNTQKHSKGNSCAASIALINNLWKLMNCKSNEMAYICEKKIGQCPAGWRRQDGICYKNFFTQKTWPEAKKDCEGYGGAMATVDQAPVGKTPELYFDKFWVGISDRSSDGKFVDLRGDSVPTAQLAAQRPNKLTECGVWSAKTLKLQSCYLTSFYTCFASLGAVIASPTSTTSGADGMRCFLGWTKHKSNCYKRGLKDMTYAAAKSDCSYQGASLLTILSQDEMDFLVADPLLLNSRVWLGYDDLKASGKYQWIDGSSTAYTYWARNDPSNSGCAEVQPKYSTDPGSWNVVKCASTRSYICKSKATPGAQVTVPPVTRPWSAKCGQGWTVDHLYGNCYFFSLDQKSWKDSQKACQKMSSELMSIESKYEQSFVQGILRGDTSGVLSYWVGGSDFDVAGRGWKWTDNKPFKYVNWNNGEPNSNGDEDCIEIIQATGKWNDNNCFSKRSYICKRPGSAFFMTSAMPRATPFPTITQACKREELISGDHWVPDTALSASSVRDKDSGPENSRLDWTAADTQVSVTTPNKYQYQPIANLNLKGVTSIAFTVQACNDAHISLQPAVDNITRDAFEIVLGGWKNSQSAIRSEHQKGSKTVYRKSGLLDCRKTRPFWISWDRGIIQVGQGAKVDNSTMFMKYSVVSSLTISGMAVSTGWGAIGKWIVFNPHGTRKGAWSPKYAVRKLPLGTEQFIYNQWIQVDFAKPTLITSVTIRGSASANEFVTQFSLQYSYDTPYNFQNYLDSTTTKTKYFLANRDPNTAVVNNIDMPFEAQYVRLYPRKFINYPSLRWSLNGCPPPKYCNAERLVTGEAMVPDYSIHYSSISSGTVYDSRLSPLPNRPAPRGWLAASPASVSYGLSEEWIGVHLQRNMLVQGIITKGHAAQKYWVKSYQVLTTSLSDGSVLVNYQEPYGTIKTFTANSDQNTAVTNKFKNPVVASYVRIFPKEYNKMIGMRLDILGCVEGCSLTPMINGPNPISDSRLSASSSRSAEMGPTRARLDTTGYGSAWVAKFITGNVFFQVDFGTVERILAISTQGRSNAGEWVTGYSLSYSQDAKTFYKYLNNLRFAGNSDNVSRVKHFLSKDIVARAIRVHPKTWYKSPALRVELYGCAGATAKYVGCFIEATLRNSFKGPAYTYAYNGPAICADSCFKQGFMYASLNKQTCTCASSLPTGASRSCDYRCNADQQHFCGGNAGLISVYETGKRPANERCPPDYDTYNDKCFKVSKVKQSWQDARTACQKDGGDLATISNWAEQSYITSRIIDLDIGAWIGLNDLQEQMSFEWADGTPVKVTYWQHSEPNNWLGKNEDCVEVTNYYQKYRNSSFWRPDQRLKSSVGWWNDQSCDKPRYSICQGRKRKTMSPSTPPPTPLGCPVGWLSYKSSCYLIVEQTYPWSLASYTCKRQGGDLVRIEDEFEQDFLTSELLRSKLRVDGTTHIWTDLKLKGTTNEYVWSNGWDIIPYTHWGEGQPPRVNSTGTVKPFGGTTYCVAMNGPNEPGTGDWTAMSCNSRAFLLCERPVKGSNPAALPTMASPSLYCPVGWLGVGPNCYLVNDADDMKTWSDAEEHCYSQGAHLAFLNNGTENEQLWKNYILRAGSDSNRYWIGLNNRAFDRGYQWISGDSFSYSNWKEGEPNDWGGSESCVMLDGGDGLWSAHKCNVRMKWICSTRRDLSRFLMRPAPTQGATFGPPGSCPSGDDWKLFKGHCYYLNTNQLTFRDADTYCRNKGAHLVSIGSSLENNQIKYMLTSVNGKTDWTSGVGSAQIWIGLNILDRDKGPSWLDGSGYAFANWAENQPNDYSGGEYCAGMFLSTGEWKNFLCSVLLPSICKQILSPVIPTATTPLPSIPGYCPTGYVEFENSCYSIVVDNPLNWTAAKSACESEAAHLTSIISSKEQTFLMSQLNQAKRARVTLWLGLRHDASNGYVPAHAISYSWSTNETVGYTNWNHGEPNNRDTPVCAEMLVDPAGRWRMATCDSKRGYVCKKQKTGRNLIAPKVDNTRCPAGYRFWEQSCYKYVSFKGTWSYMDGARCGNDRARLVSITDVYEYSFIRTWMWQENITEKIWIGLHSSKNSKNFEWSDLSPVKATFWANNEPGNFMSLESCVLMFAGSGEEKGIWSHRNCLEMYSVICKISLEPLPTPPRISGICRSAADETWVPNSDGYCYLFNVDPRYTFDEAEAACRSAGANLASLHSDTDTSFISTHMEFKDGVGGNGGTKNVWIGLRKLNSGLYQWTDSSALAYSNWGDKQPNFIEQTERCTMLYSPFSEWNDVDCQSKRGFICKMKQGLTPSTFPTPLNEVSTTLPPTTKRASPCQLDGWQFYKGNCYLMVSQRNEWKRWNEASDYCRSPGREANLVSVLSEDENQWIVENLLPEDVNGEAWLGLAELQADNRFRWIDGSPVPYVKWDDQQPDTNIGSMECVSLKLDGDASGRWSTRYCFTLKPFICKMDANKTITPVVSTSVTDGSQCIFPFKYRGQEFNTCTTLARSFLWCATSDHYERDGKFAVCDPFKCPDGWLRHEQLCYYFSSPVDKLSWTAAEQSCEDMGSELAYIGSGSVESFISDNIHEFFWIGLNDRIREGSYRWDHKPNMVMVRGFTNWGINEPRNIFGTEDCAQIVNGPYSDSRPGEWIMANCELERRYICMQSAKDMSATFPSGGDELSTTNTPTTTTPTTTTTTTTPTTTTPTTTTPTTTTPTTTTPTTTTPTTTTPTTTTPTTTTPTTTTPTTTTPTTTTPTTTTPTTTTSTTTTPTTTTKSGPPKPCPQGWYPYLDKCYFFSQSAADWSTARDICATRGAVLATVNSVDEMQFLTSQTKAIAGNKGYYVGVNDRASEGTFVNVDKSPFPGKSVWGPGQPDNAGKAEDCGSLSSFNGYRLNDSPCKGSYNFICERSSGYEDPCDSENGWHLIGDKCYKYIKEPANWLEARKSCQDNDADMLVVNTNDELSLVTESVACDSTSPVWLGYSDTKDGKALRWVDGSTPPADLMRWDTRNGEPDNRKYVKGNNCAASITLNKNLWELTNCQGNDMPYICEKDKGQCPRGWSSHKGTCYKNFFVKKTWPEAKKDCEGYGGAMATVDQATVGNILLQYIGMFWIGISDRRTDGKFADLKGNFVPASQLAAQKPNGLIECGSWSANTLRLRSCYLTNFYTCFASQGAARGTPIPEKPDGFACQNEWTKYKKNCYTRVSEQKNYNAAKTDCSSQGGALVSIVTQDEMDFLVADPLLLNTIAWIGLDNIATQGNYSWVDGSPTVFTYWAKGEPNNLNKKENCAEIQSKTFSDPGIWNDVDCNGARSYICKMKAQPGDQITTPIPTRPWSAECGQGWTVDHLSGNCYFFSLDQKNWKDSRKACQKMKSELTSIESKYEQSFVQGMFRGDTSGALAYWVGGNDLDAEQGWKWTDKKPFKYFHWNTGEPNSNGDEDCIEVGQLDGKWNDNSCFNKRNYICKRPGPTSLKASDFTTTPLPSITQGCKRIELISGDHWVPDAALSASSVRDKDSGPENSRLDWTAADAKIKVTTPNKYQYQPIANLNLKGVTSIAFTVQACNDAHISLQPAVENMTRDAFEIVVGGWSNSQSVIRSEHQGAAQVIYKKRDLLSCDIAMPFWISWDRGIIQVGKGFKVAGPTMFMKFDTKSSLTVSGMAVTTGWGANGTWVVTNPHGTRKGAWSPKYAVRKLPLGTEQFIYNQWIQVDFAKPTLITSVTIRGSASANEFVTQFSLQYSYDTPYNFQKYIRPGTNDIRYFPGNKDKDTPKVNNIEMPFEAQYVRLYPMKFINYPSLRWSLNGCPPPKYCDPERLVTGDSSVPDWCIKTSSLSSGAVYDSRLSALPGKNAPKGWLAANPTATNNILSEEWIQIYLTRDMLIFGIVTKGHATQPYWVKSYQVQTTTPSGGFKFINYQEPYGTVKTFTANSDQNTAVTNKFKNPVIASHVRIFPKEYNKMIGMRVDILGCLEGCSLTPMINGPNPISDNRLSASSSMSADMGPTRARFDTTGYRSAWVAKNRKGNFFFQVDFGIAERIKAVSTQGRSDADQWVKQYSLTYSLDAKQFYKYRGNYQFSGNSDRNTKVKYFIKDIFARAIRVHPKSWNGAPAMRIELYGCTGSTAKYVGCFTDGNYVDSFDGPTADYTYNAPTKCADSCFKEGFMYAGLNRQTCKCASSLPSGGSSARCNYKCRGDDKFLCGGYTSGVVSVYETGLGPDDERCPSDYDTYNDKCFKVSKVKQSWQDARAACQKDGGDLATISSWAEQSYIRSVMTRLDIGAWIGLNDLQEQMSFEWADGTPVKVTYWQHSEPNNWLGKKEDCVEAISYKEVGKGYIDQKLKSANGWWNDRPCEESRYSICQKRKERNSNPSTTPPTPAGCPLGWRAYQSSCYLLTKHYVTWSLASSTCMAEGGNLVRINDEFEQDFLTMELLRRVGYKYDGGGTRYWTDLRYKRLTNMYVWSNDWDSIPYTHWGRGQPPEIKPAAVGEYQPAYFNCVAMNGQNEPNSGFWTTRFCSSGGFPLCERPRGGFSQPPLPTLAPENIPCPTGWVGVGSNCYQVNTVNQTINMKNWMDAEEDCVKKGAHLAYINNATENDQLWRNYILQPRSDNNRYWIGLNDRASNQGYQWISGDPFSYSNWKEGEPNDWDGLEPCAMLDGGDGLWNDEKCFIPMNWICSVPRGQWKNIKTLRTTPEPTAGPAGSCPDGDDWKSFKGHCYFLNTNQLTFRDADTYCRSKGAHLVSIGSSLENSFVRAISKSLVTNFNARSASRANIGSVFTQVWTGLNELDRSKGHRWTDGSAYKFSNWAENEPNDYAGGEYCVGLLAANGEWNDVHCSIRIPSVCEKNPSQIGPITTTLPTLIDAFCPSGYISFENNCYKIVVNTRLNWTSAKAVCEMDNSTLASVTSSREQTFLTSQLNLAKRAQVALWLGLQHGSSRNTAFFSHATSYVWSTNEDVGYTNWDHGEPNGLDKEACAEMLYNPPGRWNDVSCASERGYVCEKPKDGTITTAPPVDNSKCPSGYTYWQENCYTYVSNKATWSYMDEHICGKDSARLLTIQDPYEYSFIRTWMWQQKITEGIWIGLSSAANSNSFIWSNGFPVVVTFWGKNEPANFATSQGCVLMNSGYGEDDGKWFHKGCSEMHSAICKIPLNDPPSQPPASGICRSAADETWVPNSDGYCYLFNVDPRYTFDEAEAACRSAGANLASLHSDTDTSFISTHMEFKDVVGGNGGTKNVWIGLRKLDSGSFQWTDFSAVYYANWAANEPNSVESNEKCTEVYSPNSEWNDVDCQSKRGFICKIKQGSIPSTFPTPSNGAPTTVVPTTKQTSPCQLDGWQFYKGNCYLMVSQRNEWKRWNEASDYCRAPGREANLVAILSEDENQWIVENLLPEDVYGEAWLGLAELQTDNRFRWIDGSPAPYVKWDDQQPDTNIGSMECVSMKLDGDTSGRWSTRYCFTLKPFICKMDANKTITPVVSTSITDGSQCLFPFKYRGQEYNTCTTLGSSFLWCATSDHYERDGKFAVCDPFKCPDGWLRHEQLCYYFSSPVDKLSWTAAEQSCENMGSELAYIGSGSVESFIADNIYEFFWIGLNDRYREGSYGWDHRPNMVMVRGFTNWGINEPRNIFGTEDCAQIVNGPYSDNRPGEWIMANCELERRYICMQSATYTLSKTTTPPTATTAAPMVQRSTVALPSNTAVIPTVAPSKAPDGKPTSKDPVVDPGHLYQSQPGAGVSSLRNGEIAAIVIAAIAVVLAAMFIILYIRRSRQGQVTKYFVGLKNPTYNASSDTVDLGSPAASES